MKEFTLIINNQRWTVKIGHMRDSKLNTPNGEYYGVCNYDNLEISIGETYPHKMRLTFIHELIHAILFSHMLDKPKHYTEEHMCEFVAKYYVLITDCLCAYDDIINFGDIK